MTRLISLTLTLTLFALPCVTSAQSSSTPNAAPAKEKETVFFDFDGGSFDGWTLSGDCWDKAPATPKTFVDKQGRSAVSGIVGNGYLTTLFKSAATTGKAVSKAFTIDKPFLTFQIGGGCYPKEACLNLLVSGKVVRTETGNDSPDLRPASWDVSAFTGKTAHLELVDTTASQNRGYIMVDDVRLSDSSNVPLIEPWKTLKYFADNSQDKRIFHIEEVFGVSAKRLIELDEKICKRVIEHDFDYQPTKFSVGSLATKTRDAVTEIVSTEKVEKGSALEQRMLASGISCWVRTHILFNTALATERVPRDTKALYWTSATLLQQPQIFAVCAGYSRLTKDLADALKLRNHLVLGVLRGNGNSVPAKFTHSWNIFVFSGQDSKPFYDPCDNTIGRVALNIARRRKGQIHHLNCFPVYPEEWGYFLWRQRATVMDRERQLVPECAMDKWTEQEWRDIDLCAPGSLIATVEAWEKEANVNIIP